MKKSNKLLLAIFLTAFLILGGIHISLMAKYKSGQYVAFEDVKEKEALHLQNHPLKKNGQIRIENIEHINLHLSETPVVKYPKDMTQLKISERDGIFVITGNNENNGGIKHYINIELYVDSSMLVSLKNSSAYLHNGGSVNQKLRLNLDNARLMTTQQEVVNMFAIGNLDINAINQSEVHLGRLQINQFNINLQNSFLHEDASTFKQFKLQADDSSRISIGSANFLKTTKTSINE